MNPARHAAVVEAIALLLGCIGVTIFINHIFGFTVGISAFFVLIALTILCWMDTNRKHFF